MGASDDRLIELEMRLMHQEKLLEQLDEVVTEQHTLIDRLRREVAQLKQQVLSGSPEDVDEPPPHY